MRYEPDMRLAWVLPTALFFSACDSSNAGRANTSSDAAAQDSGGDAHVQDASMPVDAEPDGGAHDAQDLDSGGATDASDGDGAFDPPDCGAPAGWLVGSTPDDDCVPTLRRCDVGCPSYRYEYTCSRSGIPDLARHCYVQPETTLVCCQEEVCARAAAFEGNPRICGSKIVRDCRGTAKPAPGCTRVPGARDPLYCCDQ